MFHPLAGAASHVPALRRCSRPLARTTATGRVSWGSSAPSGSLLDDAAAATTTSTGDPLVRDRVGGGGSAFVMQVRLPLVASGSDALDPFDLSARR